MKLLTLLFGLLMISLAPANAQNKKRSEHAEKPNIIIILADDLGYGDLGCYGQQMIHTPHIDSLAAKGIRFTNYYAGSSVCAPSRESLLSGFHTGHTAIRGNFRLAKEDGNLPMAKDHETIAEYLRDAGYQTALFGKWGIGDPVTGPNSRGFDYSLCYIDQIKAHNYYPPYLWENDKKLVLKQNENGQKGIYSHTLFANKTLDYIRSIKNDQPFFLYLPYTIPHGEYSLPPDTPYTDTNWPKQFKTYATMISLLDSDVGRIVQLLQEKGIADNTIIFFISDNGANPGVARFFKSNGALRGEKLSLYEGGIREPLIAYWPGKIKAGQSSDHVTAAWDFLPTICRIAGVRSPDKIDGISFLPTLQNRKPADHKYLYWEYYDYNYNWGKPGNTLPRNWLKCRATRIGKWKVIQVNMLKDKNGSLELYDLDTDPGEKNNIASAHPDIINKAKEIFNTVSAPNPPYFPYTEKR